MNWQTAEHLAGEDVDSLQLRSTLRPNAQEDWLNRKPPTRTPVDAIELVAEHLQTMTQLDPEEAEKNTKEFTAIQESLKDMAAAAGGTLDDSGVWKPKRSGVNPWLLV